jgi:hypothetical protein
LPIEEEDIDGEVVARIQGRVTVVESVLVEEIQSERRLKCLKRPCQGRISTDVLSFLKRWSR